MKIYPDQVMLAYRNGAEIECIQRGHVGWCKVEPDQFNWLTYDYRIANRTADDWTLEVFLEKCKDDLSNVISYSGPKFEGLQAKGQSDMLLKHMLEFPSQIKQLSIKKAEPKYLPFTLDDAYKLRGEWIVDEAGVQTMITAISGKGVTNTYQGISFEQLLSHYKFINDKKCGHKM